MIKLGPWIKGYNIWERESVKPYMISCIVHFDKRKNKWRGFLIANNDANNFYGPSKEYVQFIIDLRLAEAGFEIDTFFKTDSKVGW
jgi:hypothetical protein